MDAWTVFGLVKLFLDVVEGGPAAAIKGILMSGIPYSEVLDVGEIVFGLFSLDGSYEGSVVLREDQYVRMSAVKLLDRGRLITALDQHDFPKLAARQFASMPKRDSRSLGPGSFPRVARQDFPTMRKRQFPSMDKEEGNG